MIRCVTRVREVLSKEPGDEREWQEDSGDHGELLHHVVLAVADGGEVEVGRAGEEVAVGVDQVADADEVVVDVAEVVAFVELEAGKPGDLLDRAGEHVALGRDDLAHRDELALEREQPLELIFGRIREYLSFEFIDLIVDVGEQREEAVG